MMMKTLKRMEVAQPVREKFLFKPSGEILAGYYLRNKILGVPLKELESKLVIELDMYGNYGGGINAAALFGPADDNNQQLPWQTQLVAHPYITGENLEVKVVYAFTKLLSSNSRRVVAGFGSWEAEEEPATAVVDSVIGYKRRFSFTSIIGEHDGQPLVPGLWAMHEYHIHHLDDYVLCQIFKTREIAAQQQQQQQQQMITTTNVVVVKADQQQPEEKEEDLFADQRNNHFYSNCLVQNMPALLIIDCGSSNNLISASLVSRLGLSTTPLPVQRTIRWINHQRTIVDSEVKVTFSIGHHSDEVTCYVQEMSSSDISLGRPWLYDRRVHHDGYTNQYHFVFKGLSFTLVPMPRQQVLIQIRERAALIAHKTM